MCLIIHKPAGLALRSEIVADAWTRNHDSWGVMWVEAGTLVVRRSLEFAPLMETVADPALVERNVFLHLRKRTRGNIDLHNAHPYQVSPEIWLMHNGTLDLERDDPDYSDTWHLVRNYLSPILTANPCLLESPDFERLIAPFIGPDNRLVFLRSDGVSLIVNRTAGVDLMGLWLSNTYAWNAEHWLALFACTPSEVPGTP